MCALRPDTDPLDVLECPVQASLSKTGPGMVADSYQSGLQISVIGLFVNATLSVVKLLSGLLGHSTALIADAVESLCDVASSLIVWSGLRIARLPPDQNHPYGHGRAESLAALVVTMMLAGAGIGIAIEAISEIRNPGDVPAPFTLGVLLAVICCKEAMFQITRRVARTSGSTLVLADAWHHRSDAITSLAAAVGVGLAVVGGERYAVADDWAALFAAGIILINAWRIGRAPVHELMDKKPPKMIADVRAVAAGVAGVANVEKVFAAKSGLYYWVDMHVEVDAQMSVLQAHGVAHGVKDAIRTALPNVQDVLVHIEPYNPQPPRRRLLTRGVSRTQVLSANRGHHPLEQLPVRRNRLRGGVRGIARPVGQRAAGLGYHGEQGRRYPRVRESDRA